MFTEQRLSFKAVSAASLILLVFAVVFFGPAKGLYHRTFSTPPGLHDPAIEPLLAASASVQRHRFFNIYSAGKGSYGLSTTVRSVEDTPIGMTLLVKNGALLLIRDYTRDRYGIREFVSQKPSYVDLGPVLEERRNPLDDRFPEQGRVFLRCYLPSGEVTYF